MCEQQRVNSSAQMVHQAESKAAACKIWLGVRLVLSGPLFLGIAASIACDRVVVVLETQPPDGLGLRASGGFTEILLESSRKH